MPLPRAIVYGGQFANLNLEAGFLSQLPDDALARRLIYVCPPARLSSSVRNQRSRAREGCARPRSRPPGQLLLGSHSRFVPRIVFTRTKLASECVTIILTANERIASYRSRSIRRTAGLANGGTLSCLGRSAVGRTSPFIALPSKVRNRRYLVIAVRSGQGLLPEPTSGAQVGRRELVILPRCGTSESPV
jgi:hypothetical protein